MCLCDQSVCRWNATTSLSWTIDLELRNDFLEGQLSHGKGSSGGVWTLGIRLKRVD